MDPRHLCHVRLLGPIRVTARDEGPARFATRKVEALFAMIALAGDTGLDREQAAALLWSRSPEGQARANLRQALAGARRVTEALEEAQEVAGRAGSAGQQAGTEIATGAEEAVTG